jgi:peptide/nickel transport system permease protein
VTATAQTPRRHTHKRGGNWELWLGIALLAGLALFALTSLLPGVDAEGYGSTALSAPSPQHLLGTDNLGREMSARLSTAALSGLLLAVVATLLAAVVGTALALVASYFGGLWDLIIMRGADLVLSIPGLLMALVVKAILGPGMITLLVTMTVLFAPVLARIMRGPMLAVQERGFVTAAEIAGCSRWSIATGHILPNVLTPLLVTAAGIAGQTVLVEATLSYLGQGTPPPSPSAGRMVNEFQKYMLVYPHLIVLPAILILLQVVAWNLLADGLQRVIRGGSHTRWSALMALIAGWRPARGATKHTEDLTPDPHQQHTTTRTTNIY